MLALDWIKNCHDNEAKVKLQNFSSQNRRQNFSFCSVIYLEKPSLQYDSSLQATFLDRLPNFSLKQFVFRFLFRYASAVLRYHLCHNFQPGKEDDFHVILLFCRSPSLEKIYVDALKEFILFH